MVLEALTGSGSPTPMKPEQIVVRAGDPLAGEADGLIHPISGTELTPRAARFPDLLEVLDPAGLGMVRTHEPLSPGGVVLTPGGELPFRQIAHLPIDQAADPETYRRALRSALEAGLYALDQQECESCLIPDVSARETSPLHEEVRADLTLDILLAHAPGHLSRILLVDENETRTRVLKQQLERLRSPEG